MIVPRYPFLLGARTYHSRGRSMRHSSQVRLAFVLFALLTAGGCFLLPEDAETDIRIEDVQIGPFGQNATGTVELVVTNLGTETLFLDHCGVNLQRESGG